MDRPIAEYRRSDLRRPDVVAQAFHRPVQIVGLSGSLVLMATTLVEANDERNAELRRLSQLFIRMTVALDVSPSPSPVLLDELGFLTTWAPERVVWFRGAFAEAVNESLRTEDPSPARELLRMAAGLGSASFGPGVTAGRSEETIAALAERIPLRVPAEA